jgi:hypothetical protein
MRMLKIGDYVIFTLDGTRGMILGIENGLCHVVWEDQFVSWEKMETLQKLDM